MPSQRGKKVMGPPRLEEGDDCIGIGAGVGGAASVAMAYWWQLGGGGSSRQQ